MKHGGQANATLSTRGCCELCRVAYEVRHVRYLRPNLLPPGGRRQRLGPALPDGLKTRLRYEANREKFIEYQRQHRQDNPIFWKQMQERRKARWAAIAAQATKAGPFSPEEDKMVLRRDLTEVEIAAQLGRSPYSVTNRRRRLETEALPTPNDGRRWSVADDAAILSGGTARSIALQLGRSMNAVEMRRKRLGLRRAA